MATTNITLHDGNTVWDSSTSYTLCAIVTPSVDMRLSAIAGKNADGSTGTWAARVYSAGGSLVASGSATTITTGRTTCPLSSPVVLSAGTTYRVGLYGKGCFSWVSIAGGHSHSSGDLSLTVESPNLAYGTTDAYPTTATSGEPDFWFTVEAVNHSPNAPILTAPADGATIDRNSTQRFDWDFSDPDAGDSQSKFNLYHRPIGAPSWTTITGTTPNTYYDIAAGTFALGDHEWQVETYDSQGALGARSASSFFTAGDAPPAPTITAPINGATFSQSETVTWSAPEQDAYQLRVLDAADAVVFDTGEVTSATARSRTVEFPVNNVARKIQVRVKDGGLWSPYYTISGNVSWTPPPTPTFVLAADNSSLHISINNPTPAGEEPVTNYNDVYVDDGDGRGEFRLATMAPPNSTVVYYLPRSGIDYSSRVRVVAFGDNGVSASTA